MKATLLRKTYSTHQTLGTLTIVDQNNKIVFTCDTLELPWKDNQNQISCIPEGNYKAVFRDFGRYANRSFHIQTLDGKEVPDRTAILIHSGNFYTDTRGCILVGNGYGDLSYKDKVQDGILDLLNSKLTMDKLLSLGNAFSIEVKGKAEINVENEHISINEIFSPLKIGDLAKVRVSSKLNLRSSPSTDAEIVKQLNNDQKLIVKDQLDEWTEVIELIAEGWVASQYVIKEDANFFVKTQSGNLNIRFSPSINAKKVIPSGLKNKTKLILMESKENWMKVRAIGASGYVYQEYLQK